MAKRVDFPFTGLYKGMWVTLKALFRATPDPVRQPAFQPVSQEPLLDAPRHDGERQEELHQAPVHERMARLDELSGHAGVLGFEQAVPQVRLERGARAMAGVGRGRGLRV